MNTIKPLVAVFALLAIPCANASGSDFADEAAALNIMATTTTAVASPVVRGWMSGEVGTAWSSGFKGQGTTITVVDDIAGRSGVFSGKLTDKVLTQSHGQWTSLEASLIAPSATVKKMDYTSGTAIALATKGLNVINASYGLMATAGYSLSQLRFDPTNQSLITDASGKAVVVKAAGNDGINIGARTSKNTTDYLNLALRGTPSAIYVGALNTNGTTSAKATMASYSNKAGTDTVIQNRFLTVGVVGSQTNLYGTSFAAPIVSGYAAILGSKFTSATATQVSNQLLNTARTDTIAGYNAAVHGRGEASLARALAPVAIK
jgi:subtilisin family serine protease